MKFVSQNNGLTDLFGATLSGSENFLSDYGFRDLHTQRNRKRRVIGNKARQEKKRTYKARSKSWGNDRPSTVAIVETAKGPGKSDQLPRNSNCNSEGENFRERRSYVDAFRLGPDSGEN